MAASAPSVLPITSTQSAGAGNPVIEVQPPLRAFISKASDSLRHSLSQRRPWAELLDRTAFSKPETLSEATFRIRKNFSYFRINYYAIGALALAVSLLTNPFSLLILLGLLAAWVFLYVFRPSDQPLVLFGRIFTDFETLVLLSGLSLCVVFLTSVGSILVSSVMVGVAAVCIHGALRMPEDMFMEAQESSQHNRYVAFVGGAAAVNAAIAATAASPAPPR
ncbi:PRA1 family protein B2-like [Neltuma alba]|uniref:PRA1 family protein B2-like n=1 Tax=Neltuma alba TaxID=207710 RepID=UPI0010A322FD|nr:PRA1 family protein B2-like [Prosopis alba]XP_028764546.1 PRA1 family protein B2-like [Prosopis alba]